MAFLIRGGLILAIVCHSTWAYAAPFPQGKPNIFFSKKKINVKNISSGFFRASILEKLLH